MKRFLLVAMLVGAGCGDNSKDCGPGTVDKKGVCVAVSACGAGTTPDLVTGQCVPDGSMICTGGTVFDPDTSTCKADPSLCQDGTVLVGGQCVIPGTVDLDEGPEPNGLGLLGEASNNPAGTVTLKPVGEHFVLHGHINPYQDIDGDGLDDADIDAYTVTVTAPSLLHVTADGLHGLAAGFVAVSNVDSLINWTRFGINLTNDTSDRQLFLPAAGTYIIAISDTRSLFLQGGAAGSPTAEYYVTIDALDMPAPTPLAGNTVTDTIGGEVKFYQPAMGTGINDVLLDMPQTQANASVITLDAMAFKGFADESTDLFGFPVPAEMASGGFTAPDSAIVVVDDTYNYAIGPADFTLTITPSDATPLSTTGGTVSQTEQTSSQPATQSDVPLLNQFYFDTTEHDQTVGIAITWNHPVRGSLLDGDLNFVASFTTYGSSDPTWTTFRGLLRIHNPGRYYFFVYDPTGTPGTTQLSATSTITMVTPTALTESTPTGNEPFDPAFLAAAFTYDRGADPWQTFRVSGVNTGGEQLFLYDPDSAYGRLGALTASTGTLAREGSPIPVGVYTPTGSAFGRIVLDDPASYYVLVNAINPGSGTSTFNITFDKRDIIDLGTIASGTGASSTDIPLGGTAGGQAWVLFHSDPAAPATITVHPHGPPLDTRFNLLNANESPAGPTINTSALGDDITTVMPLKTWTAVRVSAGASSVTPLLFDVSVAVANPVTYADSQSSTTFADICGTAGATDIAFTADGTGNGPANDEGLSAALPTPGAFQWYGVAAPSFQVSTNGWLTFGSPTDAAYTNASLPDPQVPGIVAPYWDDLANVTACSKTTGTRMTIQWDGVLYSTTTEVHFQAILDAATNTVEFVYSTNQAALGDSATIGIEDPAGTSATQHSFNTAGSIAPGDARLFTPM